MESHHALQLRSLLKMHVVKSGLQSRSVQFSFVLGDVAFPSSANDPQIPLFKGASFVYYMLPLFIKHSC